MALSLSPVPTPTIKKEKMQAHEIIDSFSKREARAEKGLAAAKIDGNYQLLALNARQLFKCQLMQALVKWRHKEDPGVLLKNCQKSISNNAELLAKLDPTAKVYLDLPLEKAMIISYLNGKAMHLEYDYTSADMPEQRLDYLIASILFSNLTSIEFNIDASREIEILATRPDGNLASRTYQTYFNILERSSKGLSIEASLQKAEELFQLRARDAFYSGGDQTEGGGEDNKIVPDYRLAAILKKVRHHFELK